MFILLLILITEGQVTEEKHRREESTRPCPHFSRHCSHVSKRDKWRSATDDDDDGCCQWRWCLAFCTGRLSTFRGVFLCYRENILRIYRKIKENSKKRKIKDDDDDNC